MGVLGVLFKLKTEARNSILYLPFMLLWLTICCAGGFTGNLFSLWQQLQLSPLRKVQDVKSRCLLLIKAGFCGWICPLAAGHHPSPSVSPGTRTCHREVLLICISGLQAQTGIFGEQRIMSLTQMTFNMLCHREENQALSLESRRRSTRSPQAYLQSVWVKEMQMHMVLWFDSCHLTVL